MTLYDLFSLNIGIQDNDRIEVAFVGIPGTEFLTVEDAVKKYAKHQVSFFTHKWVVLERRPKDVAFKELYLANKAWNSEEELTVCIYNFITKDSAATIRREYGDYAVKWFDGNFVELEVSNK